MRKAVNVFNSSSRPQEPAPYAYKPSETSRDDVEAKTPALQNCAHATKLQLRHVHIAPTAIFAGACELNSSTTHRQIVPGGILRRLLCYFKFVLSQQTRQDKSCCPAPHPKNQSTLATSVEPNTSVSLSHFALLVQAICNAHHAYPYPTIPICAPPSAQSYNPQSHP